MNDMEWLDRVWKAYKVYKDVYYPAEQSLDHFILYLYQQYGIVTPDKRRNYERSIRHTE